MHMRHIFDTFVGSVLRKLKYSFLHPKTISGKVTLITALFGAAVSFFVFFGVFLNVEVPQVSADNVTTSVTVLNTPPQWTVDAQEQFQSSTTTPTNAGDIITWNAIGTDSNNDNYWLLICKTSALPTPNSSAAPTCGGGVANQWAVSGVTVSGTQASAATTTKATFPFATESNDWFAWICDGNTSLAQCNAAFKQGSGSTASPFVIDHPPVFSSLSNSGTVNPGGALTWTTTATTTDLLRGGDTVKLYVCKANDFTSASTTAGCGAGGTWATTTAFITINPTATLTVSIPAQDKLYPAFVFIANNFNLAATSTLQASSSPYTVNNVAPVVSAATVTLVDPTSGGNVTLVRPNATSGPYQVKFQVTDNNSCLNAAAGNEIGSVTANAFRSAIGSSTCNTSGQYNSNNCYPQASPLTDFTCTQDVGSCTGATDSTATFTCAFSLWYNADPTDVGSQFPAQNWLASAQATDDNGLLSGIVQASTGNEVISFLAFAVTETSIAFGGLQPGAQNDPLATTTTLKALGNVGLDESLFGDTMCTTWTGADSCDHQGTGSTNSIPVINQKAATSSVAYASSLAFTLSGSTTPVSVGIHVLKTTATSTPQSKLTYWAIKVPSTITVAGSYTGQDTITAVTSAASNW